MSVSSLQNMVLPEGDQSRRSVLRHFGKLALMGGSAAVAMNFSASPAMAGDGDIRRERKNFEAIRKHENAHVSALRNALGNRARPKPRFKILEQARIRDFAVVAQALENTGVGAYLAATPVIFDRGNIAAAGSIAFIEARHAGFLNVLNENPITQNLLSPNRDNDFERALTIDQVVAAAGPFIQDLNGGPPLTFSTTPSAQNDIAILNFALALEYLEAEYYNINVPKFFR